MAIFPLDDMYLNLQDLVYTSLALFHAKLLQSNDTLIIDMDLKSVCIQLDHLVSVASASSGEVDHLCFIYRPQSEILKSLCDKFCAQR